MARLWIDATYLKVRRGGRIVLEQIDEWAVPRARNMTLETMAPLSDDPKISLPGVAR